VSELRDLEVLVRSPAPLLVVETSEEKRLVDLLGQVVSRLADRPLFVWSVTEGLRRMETGFTAQKHNAKPFDVLTHIKSGEQPGLYLLLDFHPYFSDPVHVRLLKEIALAAEASGQTVVLASHHLQLPEELRPFAARFELSLPGVPEIERLVRTEAEAWAKHKGPVRGDEQAVKLLVRNLAGLTQTDARRLARRAIHDDGAITASDIPAVMRAKYDLIGLDGALAFEFDVARFADVGGLRNLDRWLGERRAAFLREPEAGGLDIPRGILLLGVQGCGKSLAARAVAGTWGVPLLRLDFGRLYDKYVGETERKLREALATATTMAPCVLWIDEIEKGMAVGDQDGGTTHRVLGMLLTWMAENAAPVFLVATANDVRALPPELVRKGRMDEIFFVDLPRREVRADILVIHMRKRRLDPRAFDLGRLAVATEGFSGAELEQAVVSALYTAHAQHATVTTEAILAEVQRTRPLSVFMAERVAELRAWAADRTVAAD
jgi:hypothetical protein